MYNIKIRIQYKKPVELEATVGSSDSIELQVLQLLESPLRAPAMPRGKPDGRMAAVSAREVTWASPNGVGIVRDAAAALRRVPLFSHVFSIVRVPSISFVSKCNLSPQKQIRKHGTYLLHRLRNFKECL